VEEPIRQFCPVRSTACASVGPRARPRLQPGPIRLGAFLLICLFVFVGCGSKVPPLPRLGPDDVILAFGDSLTYGTGATEAESYPAVLAQLTNRTVIREGVPGETTSQGLQRLPGALETHKPKILLLCLGGNDMLRKVGDATIASNLREMIRMARAQGVAVVLLGVPKPALFGGAATIYGELAEEFGLAYEGDAINDVLRKPAMKADPIHPNAQGYRVVAEAVAALLRQTGAL
jgi:acyl-CoA thioesterase I